MWYGYAIMFIGLGGGLGAVCRYLTQQGIHLLLPATFPWGTWTANLLGALILGWVLGRYQQQRHDFEGWVPLLSTGFCGGYTTFSSLSFEILTLLRQQRPHWALMYGMGSLLTGVLCVSLGWFIAQRT